jgi:LTXXQ motif family protein
MRALAPTPPKAQSTQQPLQQQQRAIIPQQQREERALRQREDRELRSLPPARRVQQREEIRRAREQRAREHRQVQPGVVAPPPTTAIPTAQPPSRRAVRRGPIAPVTPQAARQGRFAAAFAAARVSSAAARHRPAYLAARRAWARSRRAAFVAWYGPVFWPYAYSDIFDYAFWVDGYDEGFWFYVYDDFFDGIFWDEFGPPEDYAYGPAPRLRASYAGVEELCQQPGTGITSWPFAKIEREVGLTDEQKRLLAKVRDAARKAAATFKVSCPAARAFALTPPGRLQAMMGRLSATLEAVQIVRPPLEEFYSSLNDEQKERFNRLGPKKSVTSAEVREALPNQAKACAEAKPGLTNLPIEQIENVVKPTDAQAADLDKLDEAVGEAVSILQAACPIDMPLTPPGRLQAMEIRLKAMIEAANAVKPALDSFYSSLSDEQKARFNRLGREPMRSNN